MLAPVQVTGAAATATVEIGAITGITVTNPGSGYLSGSGIKKFTDPLPGLCDPRAPLTGGCPTTGKYIPLAVPEEKHTLQRRQQADEYVIGLVQYRTSFSSSLPATLVRGYVQLETCGQRRRIEPVLPADERADGRDQGCRSCSLTAYPVAGRDPAPVARADHRREQGQAGPDRVLQPPADRQRRRPVPAHGLQPDGLGRWARRAWTPA